MPDFLAVTPMGSSIISNVISTFSLPPLLETKISVNHTDSWAKKNVTSCYPFTSLRIIPIELKSGPYPVEVGEEPEHLDCFFSLFQAAKM